MRKLVSILLLFALSVGVASAAGKWFTLNSGKKVEILAVAPTVSTHGWSAYTLHYRTAVPLSDTAALRNEVDEIWEHFVVDVEKQHYDKAIIGAMGPETGFVIKSGSGVNFIFEKREGSWRTQEDKGRVKLDDAFVRALMARLDWLYDHRDMNAYSLYQSNAWTMTMSDPTNAAAKPETADRATFNQRTVTMLPAVKNYQHHRSILSVTIAPDGHSARIESRETEAGVMNDKAFKSTQKSTDWIELQDFVATLTRSTMVVEAH